MFYNLRAEIARKLFTVSSFAIKIGVDPRSFSNKLNGKTKFTEPDMKKCQKELGGTLEYLFSNEEN
jgi:hypothetical protein